MQGIKHVNWSGKECHINLISESIGKSISILVQIIHSNYLLTTGQQ